MKKDAKTFHAVAERCTRFSPSCTNCGCGSAANSTASEDISCEKCEHYTPDKVCALDLYQEIVSNHNL
jgi:hypothetical protein